MYELIITICDIGFPIAVTAYLLIRLEGKLVELTTAIGGLREAIIILHASLTWSPPIAHNLTPPRSNDPGKSFQNYPPI